MSDNIQDALANFAKLLEEARPKVQVKVLDDKATIPSFGSEGAAGFDFSSVEDVTIEPGEAQIIGTGLALAIPANTVLLLFSRSGLGFKHGLRLSNCVGVIDSDYRGEIKLRIHNDGKEAYKISTGDRIAQGVITSYESFQFEEVAILPTSERGEGGFGSTGK